MTEEQKQINELREAVGTLAKMMQSVMEKLHPHELQKDGERWVCQQMVEKFAVAAPEPTAFQQHMAKEWPAVESDSTQYNIARIDWNAAMDTAARVNFVQYGTQASDRILALKEPEL